jgi:hypothetical protein|tara:strand:+ start:1043 stop:2944 length:1902 start_codon:yes stop_codon:yes gene_type:complete
MKTKQIPDNIWEEFETESDKIKDFDISKLNLSEEDNQVLDIFFKKYLDPKEDFPSGERHSVIEKNLAIFIIKNKIPFEQIQEAYQSKGYNPNSLLSQIRGVTSGTYGEDPHINIGELVNWCKRYRTDLIEVFDEQKIEIKIVEEPEIKKKQNPFKKLFLSTDHLPYYNEFESLISLYGRQYIPIIKARWYQLHGGFIQKQIRVGSLILDSRVHVAYPLPTESGKNDIIYSIKGLVEEGIKKKDGTLFKASEPISFHQEALIGKVVERSEKNPKGNGQIKVKVENRGHLDNDFVDFDECNQLIKSSAPELQQAREYLSKAENPIGRNKVEKRSVDDLESETIGYYPKSTHGYFFQPFQKLPESFVLQGFGRRKLIPLGDVRDFLNSATESAYEQKISFENSPDKDYKKVLVSHLNNVIGASEKDYTFSDNALKLIKEYALYISGQGDLYSEKISNFCKISKWTSLSNLIKFSCILANSYYTNEVTEDFVSLAYMDLVELMQKTYEFIDERIEGEFDYGTNWGGADSKQKELLRYLYDNKCFDENSLVSIDTFTNIVMDVYRVKGLQASNKYRDMKKKKLIDSKQTGQHSTAVWLKIKPEEHKNYVEGIQGYKGYTVYNNLFLTKKDILGRVKPL